MKYEKDYEDQQQRMGYLKKNSNLTSVLAMGGGPSMAFGSYALDVFRNL